MSATEWGLLLTLAVLWGGTFLFQKVALAELPPFTILLVRVALAAAALGAAVSVTDHRLPAPGRAWLTFAVMATLNTTCSPSSRYSAPVCPMPSPGSSGAASRTHRRS